MLLKNSEEDDMAQPETIQVPLAEYQDLVKRVERLEMIVCTNFLVSL